MLFLKTLFASDDAGTDSVIVGGLFSILAMTALVAFQVIVRGGVFDPTGYALAAGGLVAAIAGGKRLRDGGSNG